MEWLKRVVMMSGFLSVVAEAGVYVAEAGVYVAEVSCQADGCLKGGWVIRNLQEPGTLLVDCIDKDCGRNGWTEQVVGRRGQVRAYCEEEGCFHKGFTSIDQITGRELSRTRCLRGVEGTPQCLTGGWQTLNPFGQLVTVTCIDSDCDKNGWQVSAPGQWLDILCKEGGCFQRGWWVYH